MNGTPPGRSALYRENFSHDDLVRLVAHRQPGHALAQAFYREPAIFEREMERIFLRSWLYAGHLSEIPRVGDWRRFELERESVIVVRAAEDRVSALVNVCRHRGSRICTATRGHGRRFTCPYHGWTYDADGALLAAPHMSEDFQPDRYALETVACEVLAGMIFLNFADDPAPLAEAKAELGACLDPYDLAGAQVAERRAYVIEANWKLAVENYCECYHCAPAHPEYSRGHALADPSADTPALRERVHARAVACGLSPAQPGRLFNEAPGFGAGYGYKRYPLLRGHRTGSRDGAPVAPLMGAIRDAYGGCADFEVGPVTFGLAYPDHVVVYAFRPVTKDRCVCELTWLVRGDAEAGTDYDPEDLTWLWRVTTEADRRIIENNAAGVASRHYTPGPLSTQEGYLERFLNWYLHTLAE